MDIDHLVRETEPDPRDAQFLEERLHEYNDAQTGMTDGTWLAIRAARYPELASAGFLSETGLREEALW